MILVTGGCGFIGSNFVLDWIALENEPIIVLDKLTYAGDNQNLASIQTNPKFHFVKGDINDRENFSLLLKKFQPRAILNFAAETHVDKSIHDPNHFIQTNIHGTFCLLQAALEYWNSMSDNEQKAFRFLQISTDEVYGSLSPHAPAFTEQNPYKPNNPYSASKAAADHLVNSYHHTYGLPTLITNCSNNYGPYQYPEKLIPLTISNALQGKSIPVYGDGLNIRDWLYVTDHCSAIREVLNKGKAGETYNIGGNNEKTNLEVVATICQILDQIQPHSLKLSYIDQITFVKDRPGHDRRYAMDASKMQKELSWQAHETFESGINKTILWYLNNSAWMNSIQNKGNYQTWLTKNYLGTETV